MQLRRLVSTQVLELFSADTTAQAKMPLPGSTVAAGFPSPADDYIELRLDLNEYLIRHPSATFYVRVRGNSMEGAGIHDEDILIVDRAQEVESGDIAVCIINGEFTVKRLLIASDAVYLIPEHPGYEPIQISEIEEFSVWGRVVYVIHKT